MTQKHVLNVCIGATNVCLKLLGTFLFMVLEIFSFNKIYLNNNYLLYFHVLGKLEHDIVRNNLEIRHDIVEIFHFSQ